MKEVMERAALAAGILLVGAVAARAQSGRSLLREGNSHYDHSRFQDAEISYRKALESPESPAAAKFNLGDALYKQKRYDEAAGQFEGAVSAAESGKERAEAYHNLGNALLKDQKYEESIDAYKNALKLNPGDDDTRYNLEYAKRLLRKQQQQQQQQKQDKKENKDRQNQKKDEQQQQQDQQNDQQKKQPPPPKDQISKADAERILEALRQQEQDVKKKLQKKVPARVKVEKDW